ncbi:MAG: hypothetical protein JJ872_06790 [Marivivens sp.]|nr:hypothetical protein [Marivivens sp.]
MSASIDYGNLMHDAMRGLIQRVLTRISEEGLPGAHHFFITFDTLHPDVELADWLSDRYPGEMTIVLQHWFDNLEVTDEGFSVTLNFGNSPEPLYIPYEAIKTFVDPSVEFGLRFETQDDESEDGDDDEEAPMEEMAEPDDEQPAHKDAEVVSLDSFRK